MRAGLQRVALPIVLVLAALSTSGCLLFELGGFTGFFLAGNVEPGSGLGHVEAMVETESCFQAPQSGGTFTSCFISDLVHEITDVSEYLYFYPDDVEAQLYLDPLVVQFPSNVGGFSGSFTGTASGALAIQSGLACVSTVPGEQLCAESGHQLVVLDFPAGTPVGAYNLSLNFTVTPPGAIVVKPVMTGKVVVAGHTFYPVLAPCVTSFAGAPSITIPASSSLVGIPASLAGVSPCVGRTIDFRQFATAVPVLGHGAFVGLALLLALFALWSLRRCGRRMSSHLTP